MTGFNEQITEIQKSISYLTGQWDLKLPDIATKDDVLLSRKDHELRYHRRRAGNSEAPAPLINKGKLVAKIGGALTAVTAAGFGIVKLVMFLMGS